jgi:hypothetical protein
MNSWGPDWIDGPKRHDQPDGSFWIDAEVCDRMFREHDSFTGSDVVGYPAQSLDNDFMAGLKSPDEFDISPLMLASAGVDNNFLAGLT